MDYQYFKGVFVAYLGADFINGHFDEWQMDLIKEYISLYCKAKIEHTCLSYQDKEKEKRKMKQDLDMYIQGVKDGLKTKRKLNQ